MKKITVRVQEDHLENLARSRPMTAIAELIWNALDAEATEVRVEFEENDLGGVETIRILDNGHGLYYDDAFIVFQNLGGSWKRSGFRTHQQKRMLHGKFGKGRFRAFSLGNRVCWNTVYLEDGAYFQYRIEGQAENLGEFGIEEARGVTEAREQRSGMVVEITQTPDNAGLLRGVKALEEITNLFALYLRQYPGLRLVYDGVPIDPANAETRFADYTLDDLVLQNGERVAATLAIVEWDIPGKRGVYLCDENGFMLHNALPRLHFRGFSYTAYLKSAHLPVLDREGLLQAGDLSEDLRQLLDSARAKLREHFTLREAEKARDTLSLWKEQDIYPYRNAPKNDSEANERRIFDIYATHLDQIFPDFSRSSLRSKRLFLRLFQELVGVQPTRIARILDEVLEFPEEKEGQILELVQQ